MTEQERIDNIEIQEDILMDKEQIRLNKWGRSIMNMFEKYTPYTDTSKKKYLKSNQPNVNGNKSAVSIFLGRKEIIGLVNRILIDTRMYDPLKYATMMVLGFLGIVRPKEMKCLRIDKHFYIDENTGFLKTICIGNIHFGKMYITRDISKQGLSPSGVYDVLLVPQVVKYVNLYLQQLYTKYPDTKGKGFLFRPFDTESNPEKPYARSSTLFNWVRYHRKNFKGVLSDYEANHFSGYDTRHTGNNLIAKRTNYTNSKEWSLRQEIAKYHCRHWGGSEINVENYQELVPEEMYAKMIYRALGFPFNVNELEDWEEKMFKESKIIEDKVQDAHSNLKEDILSIVESNEIPVNKLTVEEIQKEIDALDKELNELRKVSNKKFYMEQGLDFKKRLEKAKELTIRITELKDQQMLVGESN